MTREVILAALGALPDRQLMGGLDDIVDAVFEQPEIEGLAEADIRAVAREFLLQRQRASAPKSSGHPRVLAQPLAQDTRLHKAQYRFVTLNDQIVTADTPDIDLPLPDNLCATLSVAWHVDTPILVGEERGDVTGPMKLGEQWMLPGSTLRGLLRSVVETASFGRLARFNEHERYSFRDFTREDYRALVEVSKVRAGWLRQVAGRYEIIATKGDGKNWGVVDALSLGVAVGGADEITRRRAWAKLDRTAKGRLLEGFGTLDPEDRRRLPFKHAATDEFDQRVYVADPTGLDCALVVTGKQPAPKTTAEGDKLVRRFEYVLELPEGPQSVGLTDEAWARFEVANCRSGRKGREPDGAWAELKPIADRGRLVPVFWVGDLANNADEGFALGLTRLFKVPHAFSPGDVADRSNKGHRRVGLSDLRPVTDMAEALFGHVIEPRDADWPETEVEKTFARRGRVAVSFALASREGFRPSASAIRTIMAGPRPSFAPFYLRAGPRHGDRDWSDPDSRLAGRKRYVPRYAMERGDIPNDLTQNLAKPIEAYRQMSSPPKDPPPTVVTELLFLEPLLPGKSTFAGEIRLHNVSPVEAGAVVWALTFGGRSRHRHMIGRAKGFGAGQARATITNLTGQTNMGSPLSPGDLTGWMNTFEAHMEKETGGRWASSATINDLLAATDPAVGAAFDEAGKLSSLNLGDRPNPFQALRREKAGDRLLTLPKQSPDDK